MNCQICNKPTVTPSGYKESKILIIRDAPHKTEYPSHKSNRFRSETTPLTVLRAELFRLGVDLVQIRRANLWMHAPNKKAEECFQDGINSCLAEAKGKGAILLFGADTVKYFTGYNVSEVSGLQVESNMLSAPIIYACLDPSAALFKGMGEVRFGIENFIKKVISEDIL